MSPERWQRLKDIFGDALELPPPEREAFVRRAAADDPEMLAELIEMLRESERETDLLSRPALADAKALSREEAPRFAPSTFLARRFRIVRFIARGGMGEVYEAEDVELGERVALKAIRQRVNADSELRALFRREVQMARRVTHPNVCRIFDLAQHEDEETTAYNFGSSEESVGNSRQSAQGGQTLRRRTRCQAKALAFQSSFVPSFLFETSLLL